MAVGRDIAAIYKKTIAMTSGYNAHMTYNTTLMANQVFVNGQMMIEARWPNLPNSDDLFDRNDFREGTIGSWSTTDSLTLTDEGIPSISGGWAGGTIWVNGWFISQTKTITAHSGEQITLTGDLIASKFRKYYFLTGRLGALDAEKEFFYNGAQLYLWQPGGGSPVNVEVKKRNYAFDLSGKSNITIRKIKLFAATIITNESSTNITLDGLNARYINHNVTVEGPDLVYCHTGQTITDKGAAGLRLMGPGSVIKNSEVAFSSNMGIVLGNNCTAHNNIVHDIAYDGTYASAIAPAMGTNGQTITNNSMYRVGRSCIDLTNSQNVNIGYNDMYHFGMLNVDMGAIYSCRGYVQTGTRIHHNWIHDSKSIASGEGIQTGIYFDQGSGPVQVDHNVLWNNLVGDYYVQHTNTAVSYIYNNTFGSTNIKLSYKNSLEDGDPWRYDIMKNNIFREEFQITWLPETPDGTNSLYLTQDPLFLNSGAGGLKYRLQANSPAINNGTVISGVTDGYVGNAPDIGAYEFGGEDWVPGYVAPGAKQTPTSKPQLDHHYKGSELILPGVDKTNPFIYATPRLLFTLLILIFSTFNSFSQPEKKDQTHAEPKVITPGNGASAPSDAIVLFDGTGFSQWCDEVNGEAKWKLEDGAMTVVKDAGSIYTKQSFGDCQLHIEWRAPETVVGEGQGRGNSGVIFQKRYELQVLDSYNNPTYFDGQAGSIYNQSAPMVNASRKPGEWQTYDVVFMAPRYNSTGELEIPPRITVFQNGVLVQNNFVIKGVSMPGVTFDAYYKGQLQLQDHGNPVSYRNIWIREL